MLGEPNTEQFSVTTRVNGEVISHRPIHDPFIHSSIAIGLPRWAAFKSIFKPKKIVVEVSVEGTPAALRAVMLLDPFVMQAENAEAERWKASVPGSYAN